MIVALGTTSCVNKKKQKKEELDVKKNEIAQVVSDYVYPLPSSFEIMDKINEIEAAYIIGISNAPEEVEKYTTPEKQALNLGIYLVDFSYAAVYHRKQGAQGYLSSCEKLVRELHIDESFQNDFASQVSENIENRNALVDLLTTATQNAYSDFYKKDQTPLAALMVAGAWTEAMYLTLIVSDNTPLNTEIVSTIVFQHESLLKTIKLLENSGDNETANHILTSLNSIKNIFDEEDPKSLTANQVEQLKGMVTTLRSQLVK